MEDTRTRVEKDTSAIWTVFLKLRIVQYIVTHITIARQRLGMSNPEVTLSAIEWHPLLDKEPIKMLLYQYAARN
jgi:hypothetical protein